ncbi:MAG: hypothetical protein ABI866_09155, partial [Dokdonella sp.]
MKSSTLHAPRYYSIYLLYVFAIALVCMSMSPVSAQTSSQMDPYLPDGSPTLSNYKLDLTYGA